MSTPTLSSPYEVENCRGVLRVYSDGSVSRSAAPLTTAPLSDDGSVEWEDVLFDLPNNLHLRLYRPKPLPSHKLPVLVYIHGGGFCIGSRTWPNFHNYCSRLSAQIPAVVVAPDYRLAPESRIPAAIDDCFGALMWVRDGGVATWEEAADLDRVFVAGDSAGGNIVHNLAVRLGGAGEEDEGERVYSHGAIFWGDGTDEIEVDGPKDAFLDLELIDRYWRLSIPEGDNTDNPMVNPFGPLSPSMKPIVLGPMLVIMGSSDLLKDRAAQYANRLQELGKEVEYVEFPGQEHGFFIFHPDSPAANDLMLVLKTFISNNSGPSRFN